MRMMKARILAPMIVTATMGLGCAASPSGTPEQDLGPTTDDGTEVTGAESFSTSFGPAGGTLAINVSDSTLNGVELVIPKDAFESDTKVTVSVGSDPLAGSPISAVPLSVAVRVLVDGDKLLLKPAYLRIPLVRSATNDELFVVGKHGSDLVVPLGVELGEADSAVVLATDRFSDWGAYSISREYSTDFDVVADSLSEYSNSWAHQLNDGDWNTKGTCFGVSWLVKQYWVNYRSKCGPLSILFSGRPIGTDFSVSDRVRDDEFYLAAHLQKLYMEMDVLGRLLQARTLVFAVNDKLRGMLSYFPSEVSGLMQSSASPLMLGLILADGFHAVVAYAVDESGRILVMDPKYPGEQCVLECGEHWNSCRYRDDVGEEGVLPLVFPRHLELDRINGSKDSLIEALVVQGKEPGGLSCESICSDAAWDINDEGYNWHDCATDSGLEAAQWIDGSKRWASCSNSDNDTCLDRVFAKCGDGSCDYPEMEGLCPADCNCQPECGNRGCGPDPVCGTSCGTCGDGWECNASGICVEEDPVVVETWFDSTSGLTWQVVPTGGTMKREDAKSHCAGLDLAGGGWHLPTISELRSLIRGCDATETGGSCQVTDTCLDYSDCRGSTCFGCSGSEGPGKGGAYWPDLMEGEIDTYWSSSPVGGSGAYVFCVGFGSGSIFDTYGVSYDLPRVRCVR